jgi:NADH dehydrogenase/NADH:ubiquinone oxidoreductase subunit G
MFYKIKINGSKILLTNPSTLINNLSKVYIYIPRFCYNPTLVIASNCRMCLIEIEKGEKLILSCAFPFYENINLITKSPKVQKARENIIEFLLLNHPLDCPICDMGGECDLQDQTLLFSSNKGKHFNNTRNTLKLKFFNFFLNGIMTRCIQCTKCTRLSISILTKLNSLTLSLKHNLALGLINRGNASAISIFSLNYKD